MSVEHINTVHLRKLSQKYLIYAGVNTVMSSNGPQYFSPKSERAYEFNRKAKTHFRLECQSRKGFAASQSREEISSPNAVHRNFWGTTKKFYYFSVFRIPCFSFSTILS